MRAVADPDLVREQSGEGLVQGGCGLVGDQYGAQVALGFAALCAGTYT